MVFVLKWPGPLCPGSLCPRGRGGKFSLFSPQIDLLTKVMTINERQYNVPHITKNFQKKSHRFIERFIQIYKLIFIRLLPKTPCRLLFLSKICMRCLFMFFYIHMFIIHNYDVNNISYNMSQLKYHRWPLFPPALFARFPPILDT